MLRTKAILSALVAWALLRWKQVSVWRGLSTAMLPVLISAFAASGLSFAWCESMQTVSCCCCNAEPTLDEVFAELSNERFSSKLEAAPCCGTRDVPSVPDAERTTPNDVAPAWAAVTRVPEVVIEPAPRFSGYASSPPSVQRPCDPARAGPPTASQRCVTLQRFHC